MIFSWSSKGTHIAPIENNDYVGHFVPYSFWALLFVDQRIFTEVDLSGVRLSVRPFVCLSNCLFVNMFVDGPELFRYLHNLTLV